MPSCLTRANLDTWADLVAISEVLYIVNLSGAIKYRPDP